MHRAKKSKFDSKNVIETAKRGRDWGRDQEKSLLINGMPTEVFTEMASNLLPFDLLQMSRTSRTIRSILMSKSSAFVWCNALKNHPTPLPDLPQNLFLNEPQYIALVFEKSCQSCWSKRKASKAYYTMSVRLCDDCFQDFTMSASDISTSFLRIVEECFRLSVLVPLACPTKQQIISRLVAINGRVTESDFFELHDGAHFTKDPFPREMFLRVVEEYLERRHDPDDQMSYALEQVEWVHGVYYFKYAMDEWETSETKRLQSIEKEAKLEWEKRVFRKLWDLHYGYWEMRVDPLIDPKLAKEWTQLTQQTRPFTERIWRSLRPKLENIIMENKKNINERLHFMSSPEPGDDSDG